MPFALLLKVVVPIIAVAGGAAFFFGGSFFSSADPVTPTPQQEEYRAIPDIAPPREADSVIAERRASGDLLPDLLPLPPRDLMLETRADDGALLLRFSTTYYNAGDGTMELKPDAKTAGIRADIERTIYQRIYHTNGSFRDKAVGTFMWHQEHLHYHYADFIEYDLESLDDPSHPDLSGSLVKSTFCLRDISTVDLPLPNKVTEAAYKICGKELQGVSVGWGDTYYYDYPGQVLDITGLTSGLYRLTFDVNPALRVDELRYDNNVASALFRLDMEAKTVTVIEEYPSVTPHVEHVHLEDPFGGVAQ